MVLTEEQRKQIIDLYRDPKQGLSNVKDLYAKINKDRKVATYKQIKDVIANIDVVQQFQRVNAKKLDYIPIAASSNSYQMDLMFIDKIHGFNDRTIGLLNIINMNTRKAWSYPIKNKSAQSVLEQFKNFQEETGLLGQNASISSDNGKEFNNKFLKGYLEEKGIKFIVFDKELSPNANMLVERFNKTLRGRIDKYLNLNKTKRYIDVLQDLVDSYNNSEHNATGEVPNDLKQEKYLDLKAHINKTDVLNEISGKINIDDNVRLLKQKKGQRLFAKGQKNYTKNVFNVKQADDLGFLVEDEKGNEQRVMPFQMKQINKKELIAQEDTQKGVKKGLVKQAKVKRALIKEGYDAKSLFNFS